MSKNERQYLCCFCWWKEANEEQVAAVAVAVAAVAAADVADVAVAAAAVVVKYLLQKTMVEL